jgi:hypothetical protein
VPPHAGKRLISRRGVGGGRAHRRRTHRQNQNRTKNAVRVRTERGIPSPQPQSCSRNGYYSHTRAGVGAEGGQPLDHLT